MASKILLDLILFIFTLTMYSNLVDMDLARTFLYNDDMTGVWCDIGCTLYGHVICDGVSYIVQYKDHCLLWLAAQSQLTFHQYMTSYSVENI